MLDNIKKEILPGAVGCYESGWEKIRAAMMQIFRLSDRARRLGILILEDGLEEMENEDLKFFLRLVLDGVDTEVVEEYMENLYFANPRRGLEGLLYLIYAYGTLYVQVGHSEYTIQALFKSLVPIAYHKDVIYEEGVMRREAAEKIKEIIEQGKLSEAIKFTHTEDSFTQKILALPDDEFKILCDKVYHSDDKDCNWDAALKYSTFELISRFIEGKETGSVSYWVDSINEEHTKEDSDKAKEKILKEIDKMKQQAELVSQGNIIEAFEMNPIEDDFSKVIEGLSEEKLKTLIEKTTSDNWHYALKYVSNDIINKVGRSIDFPKAYSIFKYLGRYSRWESGYSKEHKEKILDALKQIN